MDKEKLIELLKDEDFFESVCRELTHNELICLSFGIFAFKNKAEKIYFSNCVEGEN